MRHLLTRLVRDESGQGMVEYALIIALVAIVVIVTLTDVGTAVMERFVAIVDGLRGS